MSKAEKTQDEIVETENWMPKVLILGTLIGAVTGLVGAYLLIQRSKNDPTAPRLNTGEGMRLGALLIGLLRQIQMLGEGD